MKKLLVIFTSVTILSFSCRAPEDMDRDKFEGTWLGPSTTTTNCGGAVTSSSTVKFKIEKEGTNKLKLSDPDCKKDCPVIFATAKGNALNTEPYSTTDAGVTTTLKSGTLNISGSDLSGTLPLELSSSNNGLKFTCGGSASFLLKKQ